MPRYSPKDLQKELETGWVWPVYWIYGPEKMKARELIKKIQRTILGTEPDQHSLQIEKVDASEVSEAEIADFAMSPSLFGGRKIYLISEAHRLSDVEALDGIWGEKTQLHETSTSGILIFLSKDLDARKKLTKSLLAHAAVVECEAVKEEERLQWVQYLSKRRGLVLSSHWLEQFCWMDPWTLEGVDQELEKLEIATLGADGKPDPDLLEQGAEILHLVASEKSDTFVGHFMSRNYRESLGLVQGFAEHLDEALPLMGLLSWNAKTLIQVLADQQNGTRTAKMSPQGQDRFRAYSRLWTLSEAIELQSAIAELDFSLKQTSRDKLGLWTQLVNEFSLKSEG